MEKKTNNTNKTNLKEETTMTIESLRKNFIKDELRDKLYTEYGVYMSNNRFKKMKKNELIENYLGCVNSDSLDLDPIKTKAEVKAKETIPTHNYLNFKEAMNRRDPSTDEEYCDRCNGYGIFHTRILNNEGIPASPDDGICYKCKGYGVQKKNVYAPNNNVNIIEEETIMNGTINNIITCCGTGRRPKNLFGYEKNNYLPIIEKMKKGVRWLYDEKGVRKFITGGAQGWDQLLFWAVNAVKREPNYSDVINSVYIPFKGQELKWSADGLFGKREYYLILKMADEIKYITNFDNTSSYKDIVDAMMSRNHAMVNDSNYVFGCYQDDSWILPETKGGTSECLKYSVNNDKDIIILYFSNMSTKYMNAQNTNYGALKNIIKGVK